ncbi:metalloprotease PmbA [Methylophaga sp. OBS4]|uniref:metalloprotease PmbA n=1 Tax=Methylophaga sp. OBS4 TaxID=2991935 RepID=UPI002259FB76|nr:metalloprotease PmbA [Methylophaga sp. OBS4]MCX4187639.1 metalloprotease PmbA [Methylophaga sp. OBS4]
MSQEIVNTGLEQAAEIALEQAKKRGASAAEVGVNHSEGLSVTVRQREVETLEHNNDTGLGVTVYFGQSKASASTSDLSPEAISEAVAAACNIAKHTQPDEAAGLADADLMADFLPDLSLYHPWALTVEQAIDLATICEQAGLDYDAGISNSEGATLSSHSGDRVYANSHGFIGATQSSRHSLSCSLIARDDRGMQREYWYDIARDKNDLNTAESIGLKAAQRTMARLGAGEVKTGSYPVLFAAEVAPSLFGQLIGAIRGSALYRKATFLLDKKGEQIFPAFVHIHEQPHLHKALGSAAFDAEGVATQNRDIIRDGVLQGYVLDSYSARRLGMKTTANAGGVHNLTVDSSADQDFAALVKQLDKGIIVTETMGMGVNIVNGDYSQGAAGFWVENGEIQFPVDEFTIASNLQDMFMGIQAIGNDIDLRGNTRCGSVLLENMMIASS